jgi:hypothetical protein
MIVLPIFIHSCEVGCTSQVSTSTRSRKTLLAARVYEAMIAVLSKEEEQQKQDGHHGGSCCTSIVFSDTESDTEKTIDVQQLLALVEDDDVDGMDCCCEEQAVEDKMQWYSVVQTLQALQVLQRSNEGDDRDSAQETLLKQAAALHGGDLEIAVFKAVALAVLDDTEQALTHLCRIHLLVRDTGDLWCAAHLLQISCDIDQTP